MKFGMGAAVLAVAVLSASTVAAGDLSPHRAIYRMSLNSANPASGISGASGAMTYEFGDSCDGWTVANKTVLNLVYNEGGQVNTTWDFLTWESKDGLRYRYRVRSTRDGQVSEEVDGTARMDGRAKGGVATFTLPEPQTIKLPAGTLFPTEHTARLLERAAAGDTLFARVVFDGSNNEGPSEVSALIGRRATPALAQANHAPNSPLLDHPAWRIQMAFFPIASQAAEPEYEVGVIYYDNGVAGDVLQNFGSFSLKGKLEKVEKLPKPDC